MEYLHALTAIVHKGNEHASIPSGFQFNSHDPFLVESALTLLGLSKGDYELSLRGQAPKGLYSEVDVEMDFNLVGSITIKPAYDESLKKLNEDAKRRWKNDMAQGRKGFTL